MRKRYDGREMSCGWKSMIEWGSERKDWEIKFLIDKIQKIKRKKILMERLGRQ